MQGWEKKDIANYPRRPWAQAQVGPMSRCKGGPTSTTKTGGVRALEYSGHCKARFILMHLSSSRSLIYTPWKSAEMQPYCALRSATFSGLFVRKAATYTWKDRMLSRSSHYSGSTLMSLEYRYYHAFHPISVQVRWIRNGQ